MEGAIIFFVFLLGLFIVAAPIISLVSLSRLSKRVDKLSRQVEFLLARASSEWEREPHPSEALDGAKEELAETIGEAMPESAGLAEAAEETFEAELEEGAGEREGETAPTEEEEAPPIQGPWSEAAPAAAKGAETSWEETLASSWMIWLGGVTVALAAVFLFRYAIDEGWLTPLTRVILGLVLGGVLLGAGERALRSTPAMVARAVNPDYVPPALSAAGIFAVFASIFAAHGLYDLMAPASAFIALALTAYSALALSLRQGWFVALLGILGGYLVPALIDTPEPNAVATFLYLFVLSLGALALMVWRRWRWFSVLTIAGALLWPYLYSLGGLATDQLVVESYLLALAASFAALSVRLPVQEPQQALLQWMVATLRQSAGIGFALSGALLLHVAQVTGFNAGGFVFLVLYTALAVGLGNWRQSLEGLLPLAAIVALAAALLWPQPLTVSPPAVVQELGVVGTATPYNPNAVPPEFLFFWRTLWAFAAVFGLGGFLSVFRVRAKPLWAGLSALFPVLLFVIGYWRIADFQVDIDWGYWAIALSALLLVAAVVAGRRLSPETRNIPLAFYAAGVTAAIALAFSCLLREAWLTVALAAEVAALSWIWSRLRVRELRKLATVLLAVVTVRLVLNPMILDYRGSFFGLFSWVVYGYGLPALFTALAARVFSKGGRDLPVVLSEIAAAGFGFLMVALQLRLWTAGALIAPKWDLLDATVQVIWWIVASMLLLSPRFTATRPWARIVGLGLLAASALLVATGPLQTNNPILAHERVGPLPLFNLISLAYLVPALLYSMLGLRSRFDVPEQMRGLLQMGAGFLLFVDLSFEVRHAFWGSQMTLTGRTLPSNGEIYAYSAAWILFALALLAAGILRRSQPLRYASLAVLLVTVVKVFLYDMSDLTGLFRVASFLGLGVTLIAIGRIYRVFVFRPDGEARKDSDEASSPRP